jgi:uncharacterized coiled-coil protein SlyX
LDDQIAEISKLLADAQRKQEQAQFALRTLQERLAAEAEAGCAKTTPA